MNKKWLGAAAAVVLAAAIAGCGGNGGGSGSASKIPKDMLVVGIATDVASVDPAVAMENWQVPYYCYERLVQYKMENGKPSTEVEGSLAKSWTVSDDGLTWTFKLNTGHKFADGTEVDAKAVKFSFDRVKAIKKGPSDYFKLVQSVEAPDSETVVITLTKPFAPFLQTLAVDSGNIVNPKVMEHEQNGDFASGYLASHSAGSGPYQISEFNQGQSIKLTANPNYAGKKPALSAISFQIIKDPSAQRLQLEKGDLDVAAGIPMNQLEELKKNKDVTIHEAPGMLCSVIYLNNTKAPLDNVKFRQALSYAVDYKGIIDGAVKGHGEQLTTPVPKGMWGRDDNAAGYTYDVNKAKELLAQSGVPEGTQLTLLYSDNQPFNETQALMLQNNLKAIGLDLKLEKTAWPTFRERVDKKDFEMGMGTWSPDYADPQNYMSYWFDSGYFGLAGNRSFYQNPEVDALLREAETSSDHQKRIELYQKAQNLVLADAPYLFLFQTNAMVPMRANVKGFVYNPMLDNMYNFADMSKE